MPSPFFPIRETNRSPDDAIQLAKYLGGKLSGTSEVVEEYEKELSIWFGAKYAVSVSSGSAALYAALHIAGAGPGKEVIVPAIAPIPTVLPVLAAGATPVFVDTNPTDFGTSISDLRKIITPHTVAFLSVPLWGYPFDQIDLFEEVRSFGIKVVEDAAQAHGSQYGKRFVGTVGDIGCFSTHDNKPLSTGEGGFILTNDAAIYERLRSITRLGGLDGFHFGWNYKLSGLCAAYGTIQLRKLRSVISKKRASAEKIISSISHLPFREISFAAGGIQNCYSLVLTADPARYDVPLLRRLHHEEGIESDFVKYGYDVAYKRAIFQRYSRTCPNAERLVSGTLPLPCHVSMNERLVARVADVLALTVAQAER
ncbi:aspartate aminotransferase [Rhizobium leguminosarum]|uniref:DegT/DnrJ/EryC1/StrS family aminotransferase n=1 Tax=Rhizobium leguminosarum TaxID=384 RepID=UPI001C980C58|nr:DegT/DnrJ/EryC1/StrS family aminotransferase [Rhizobium leguminosarum]MBY5336075.1 aspartate aminotransferase [Rhizobium leguminosarum]